MTAKFLSDRTGEVTIAVSSISKQLHTYRITDHTPEYKETGSVGRRKLMTPDEVLRMPLDEALIILRGQNVFRVKKFDYTKHPDSKKLRKRKAVKYIPAWRQEELDKAAARKTKRAQKPQVEKEMEQQIKIHSAQQPKEAQEQKKEVVPISKKELMRK